MTDDAELRPVRVWDLPTRLFHWTLALCIVGSLVTAKIGGNAMVWHIRLGIAVLALLAFRVLWGLVGGHWSRFLRFIYSPMTLLRYVRGRTHPGEHLDVGHNPLGALSVFGLLTFLAIQVATGLVADDEIATVGPLNKFVTSATASLATGWHKVWGQWILIALVCTHLAAIIFYLTMKSENLVRPMISGDKSLPAGTPASSDSVANRVLAAVLAVACAAIAIWVLKLGG